MKPLVIYHANCTDGFAAAYAAWCQFKDAADYLPASYGEEPPNTPGRRVYILDFSYPEEIMERLFAESLLVVWLDHHQTAFDLANRMFPEKRVGRNDFSLSRREIFIKLSSTQSGAKLAWEYFMPDVPCPKVIQHIDDRDRWQFKLKGSRAIHSALQARQPWKMEQWDELMKPEYYDELMGQGYLLLKVQDNEVNKLAREAHHCQIGEHGGLMVNTSTHISELGNVLATECGTFALVWSLDHKKKVRCSLRSVGEFDVAEMASQFGGGGHKNAAGFSTDIHTLLGFMK